MSAKTPVRVSSLIEAWRSKGWAHQVVSLLDPDINRRIVPKPEKLGVAPEDHLVCFFDDVESESQEGGVKPPMFEHIIQIVEFVKHDKNVLVHCHAGISRSSATAIGLMIARGFEPRDAARLVLSQNVRDPNEGSVMHPNLLILEFFDAFFGLKASLTRIVAEEMKAAACCEEEFDTLLARCGQPRSRFVPTPKEPVKPVVVLCEKHALSFDTRWGCPHCR